MQSPLFQGQSGLDYMFEYGKARKYCVGCSILGLYDQ